MDRNCFDIAKDNLTIISNINKYIIQHVSHFVSDDLTCGLLLDKNFEADHILTEIIKTPTIYWFDMYLSFWVYESTYSVTDSNDSYNALLNKYDNLIKQMRRHPRDEAKIIDLAPIDNALSSFIVLREKYVRKLDDVIILTATPVELKTFLRKITLIINVYNRNELVRILNPKTNQEALSKRKKTWLEGIIFKNGKWIKIRLVLPEQYGSIESEDSLNQLPHKCRLANELLVIGVSGQLEKTGIVKIGDLIITNGFYNAYQFKDIQVDNVISKQIENTISFSDSELKPLSEDYELTNKFDWRNWRPSGMLISRPHVTDKTKQNTKFSIYKGPIVSGPSVVKQPYKKELLQTNFPDALAVEMETQGCYTFIKNQDSMKLKVIKAISDWSDTEKDKIWQPYCAELAAEFAIDYIIAKYGHDEIPY